MAFHIHPLFSISTTVALVKVLISFLQKCCTKPISPEAMCGIHLNPRSDDLTVASIARREFCSAVSLSCIPHLKFLFPTVLDVYRVFSNSITWDLIRISGPTSDSLNRDLHLRRLPWVIYVHVQVRTVLFRTGWKGSSVQGS